LSKTGELRKLIKTKLDTIMDGKTYYVSASAKATFPYAVFSFQSVDLGDLSRDDIELCVDVLNKATSERSIEDICDDIEALFNGANFPTAAILPTIWRQSRYPVQEDDKAIRHIQMTYYIQNYERT